MFISFLPLYNLHHFIKTLVPEDSKYSKSLQLLMFLNCDTKVWAAVVVDDPLKLAHVLFYKQNWVKIVVHNTQTLQWPVLSSAVQFGVLAPEKLLPSLMKL